MRQKGCLLTDDVLVIEVKDKGIDLDYLRDALQESVYTGNFIYEAKIFQSRASSISVDIPISDDGSFDLELQRLIASENRRLEAVRSRIADLGLDATTRRFTKDDVVEPMDAPDERS